MDKIATLFSKISKSSIFNIIITFVILLAGINVGLETSSAIMAEHSDLIRQLDYFVLILFVIEILVNTLAEGKRPWRFFYKGWHIFDFIVVALCFIPILLPESNTGFIFVFRIARLLRLAKILDKIQNLKLLLLTLFRSMPKMLYVVMLLGLLFYMYGVIGTGLFGEYEPDTFGNLWLTMKQLFFVTFEGWSWIYDLEGIQLMLANGFPDFAIVLYFISFLLLSAMIFLNLFIAIITTNLESVNTESKRSKLTIQYHHHTLILGWNNNIYQIISELVKANESKEIAHILIVADREADDMAFDISEKVGDSKTTKIHCKSGDFSNISNLTMANSWKSKSIILLNNISDNEYELRVLKTLVVLINQLKYKDKGSLNIIADLNNETYINVAKSISNGNITIFDSEQYLAFLIANTCVHPNISLVYSELTGFDGSEFYVINIDSSLIGKTFRDAVFSYEDSTVIGVIDDNGTVLCPNQNIKLKANDRIVLIAEDDSTIKLKHVSKHIEASGIEKKGALLKCRRNILILGSNNKLPLIFERLNYFLIKGSIIKVVTSDKNAFSLACSYLLNQFTQNDELIEIDSLNKQIKLFNLEIFFFEEDIQKSETIEKYIEEIDHISVLSYCGKEYENDLSDTITLVILIHLKNIIKTRGLNISVCAELQDPNNKVLIDDHNISDIIVGNNIISPLIAQISEDKVLNEVIEQLVITNNARITLCSASNYCNIDREVSFATIVESALKFNEIAIGYLENSQSGNIFLNPSKSKRFKIGKSDQIVLIVNNADN